MTNRLKRISNQLALTKNRILFLERCRHHSLTPRFLNVKCPIKSPHARRLTEKYQKDLVCEILKLNRADLHRKKRKEKDLRDKIETKVSPPDFKKITNVIQKSHEKTFKTQSQKLRNKFQLILEKQKPKPPSRPSTIKNTILQLQSEPLSKDEIELLSLGPQFKVTPKETPFLEIISAIEPQMTSLEFQGKQDIAKQTRHDICNALLKFNAKPKLNLTFTEKKGSQVTPETSKCHRGTI